MVHLFAVAYLFCCASVNCVLFFPRVQEDDDEEEELREGKQRDKEQLCNISRALAVLASASV